MVRVEDRDRQANRQCGSGGTGFSCCGSYPRGNRLIANNTSTAAHSSRCPTPQASTASFGSSLNNWLRVAAAGLGVDGAQSQLESISTDLQVLIARRFGGRRRAAHGQGARSMILAHLQTRVGEWVEGQELAAISGIQEWARRVRELRVEDGFDIEEEAGRYRLRSKEPDVEAAQKWRTAHEIGAAPAVHVTGSLSI